MGIGGRLGLRCLSCLGHVTRGGPPYQLSLMNGFWYAHRTANQLYRIIWHFIKCTYVTAIGGYGGVDPMIQPPAEHPNNKWTWTRNRALQIPLCVIIVLIANRVDADETIELLKLGW